VVAHGFSQENRLGNLPEERESDLAEWPQTPDSLHASARHNEDGDKEQEEASARDDEKAALMSPPALRRDVTAPTCSQTAAACPASAASLAAILQPGKR